MTRSYYSSDSREAGKMSVGRVAAGAVAVVGVAVLGSLAPHVGATTLSGTHAVPQINVQVKNVEP
jgi:hypothetical protein